MDQKIINLFDEYTHKPLTRTEFMNRLARLTGSVAAATAILPFLELNYAKAATIAENDQDIKTENISYPSGAEEMKGYFARPSDQQKHGAVLVIHENRGLNPHIKDITRRMAKAGFAAMAPDALSSFGGTPEDEDKARELIGKLDKDQNLQNFLNGLIWLRKANGSNGKTGCVGFCWGGGMANQLAVHDPSLNAAVAYYGRQPDGAEVKNIKAKLMLHYGGLDERVNAGIPAYEKALKEAGVSYELFIYDGAQHAFNNDTAPTRYNDAAAKLAWQRTLDLFKSTIS